MGLLKNRFKAMTKKSVFVFASLLLAVTLVTAFYWLTLSEVDPCDNPQADISAAIIADGDQDQAGLANRAIIMHGACDKTEDTE